MNPDKTRTVETPDKDSSDDPNEGERKRNVRTRDLVDDYLWEQYGFGLTKVEEELADRAMTEPPWDDVTTEHVAAISPNEVTAGVHVRRVDVDERIDDMPFMVELEQYFPPEDDRAGDTVALHGEHALLELIAALASVTSSRFEEVPWDVD